MSFEPVRIYGQELPADTSNLIDTISNELSKVDSRIINIDNIFSRLSTPQQLTRDNAIYALDTWMSCIKVSSALASFLQEYTDYNSSIYTDPQNIQISLSSWSLDRLSVLEGRLAWLTDRRFQLTPPFLDVQVAMQDWFRSQEEDWRLAHNDVISSIRSLGKLLSEAEASNNFDVQSKLQANIIALDELQRSVHFIHSKLLEIVSSLNSQASVQGIGGTNWKLVGWGIFIGILALAAIFTGGASLGAISFLGISLLTVVKATAVIGLASAILPIIANIGARGIRETVKQVITGIFPFFKGTAAEVATSIGLVVGVLALGTFFLLPMLNKRRA